MTELIERLVAMGWVSCHPTTATLGSLSVLGTDELWELTIHDCDEDSAFIVPPQRTETALLRSRVGSVTVAAILGLPDPPSVDEVIRERLIAAGWVRDQRQHHLFEREGWQIWGPKSGQPAQFILGEDYDQSGRTLADLMRAPFGSVTVAQFCGIDVSDLEVDP